MAIEIPKGRLVKGPYKPICRDCAIYFSITVIGLIAHRKRIYNYSDKGINIFEKPAKLGNRLFACNILKQQGFHIPYPFTMYGIFTCIYHNNQANVGKCIIHGSYGYRSLGPLYTCLAGLSDFVHQYHHVFDFTEMFT